MDNLSPNATINQAETQQVNEVKDKILLGLAAVLVLVGYVVGFAAVYVNFGHPGLAPTQLVVGVVMAGSVLVLVGLELALLGYIRSFRPAKANLWLRIAAFVLLVLIVSLATASGVEFGIWLNG